MELLKVSTIVLAVGAESATTERNGLQSLLRMVSQLCVQSTATGDKEFFCNLRNENLKQYNARESAVSEYDNQKKEAGRKQNDAHEKYCGNDEAHEQEEVVAMRS